MPATRFVRIAFRLPPTIPLKYQQLAQRYGYTRSDLYRLGLEHGFAAVQRWCERSTDVLDLPSLSGGAPDLSSALAGPDSQDGRGSSSETPLSRLARFAKTLVGSESAKDVSQLKRQLVGKADALGLSRVQSDPYVDVLATGVFQQSARRIASSKRSQSNRVSPSTASETPVVAADVDPDLSDVPELD